ncbi:restriction endonuclease subunit S [Colwellia sp. PAMC 21821]|uniref:restriction endonuclease subunit S n=1 Tax=Colwellia sp. PAMC 21821 TaxID=1816219 RepID=UPI0009BE7570|nr:restriction endonuclease subunit S [Colwellia sp. PAMC 21821]ARD44444.1 restriction endonuclease [Colwellia sp. PAMC 21821]
MLGKYQAYSEYQNSGVRWFGLVPNEWISSRLKFESSINMGQSPNSVDCNQDGLGLPFLQGNAEFGIKSPTPKQYCDVSRKVAQKGNLLFSVRAPVGALNLADQTYGIGRGLCAISNNESLTPDFLWWLIPVVRSELDSVSTGSTFEAVSAEQVENVVIYKPSIFEQEKIASFLNHETAKIDTLIEKQQQLIKLLKEKRQAVISHAVTKGINPKAPIRDSGVEWLGGVPEHWKVCRIKQIAKLASGHTPDKKKEEYWVNCEIPWVSLNDSTQLKQVDYITDTSFYLNEKGLENSSAKKLPKRCVVFTRDASIGLAAITTRIMAVSQHVIAWVCNESETYPEYLLLVFYAMKDELDRYTAGATLKTIGMPDVNKLTGAFPQIEEQKEIAEYTFKQMNKFDLLISKSEKAIELIKERRTALISAAVTGKIDVRHFVSKKGQRLKSSSQGSINVR